jgi:pimeloyl-ACP methyl ester carboxylesterase
VNSLMQQLVGDQLHDRLKAAFEEATLYDVEDRLEEIQVPTLVVGGRQDPIDPPLDPTLVNVPNNYLYFAQATRYHFNPTMGNLLKMFWTTLTLK